MRTRRQELLAASAAIDDPQQFPRKSRRIKRTTQSSGAHKTKATVSPVFDEEEKQRRSAKAAGRTRSAKRRKLWSHPPSSLLPSEGASPQKADDLQSWLSGDDKRNSRHFLFSSRTTHAISPRRVDTLQSQLIRRNNRISKAPCIYIDVEDTRQTSTQSRGTKKASQSSAGTTNDLEPPALYVNDEYRPDIKSPHSTSNLRPNTSEPISLCVDNLDKQQAQILLEAPKLPAKDSDIEQACLSDIDEAKQQTPERNEKTLQSALEKSQDLHSFAHPINNGGTLQTSSKSGYSQKTSSALSLDPTPLCNDDGNETKQAPIDIHLDIPELPDGKKTQGLEASIIGERTPTKMEFKSKPVAEKSQELETFPSKSEIYHCDTTVHRIPYDLRMRDSSTLSFEVVNNDNSQEALMKRIYNNQITLPPTEKRKTVGTSFFSAINEKNQQPLGKSGHKRKAFRSAVGGPQTRFAAFHNDTSEMYTNRCDVTAHLDLRTQDSKPCFRPIDDEDRQHVVTKRLSGNQMIPSLAEKTQERLILDHPLQRQSIPKISSTDLTVQPSVKIRKLKSPSFHDVDDLQQISTKVCFDKVTESFAERRHNPEPLRLPNHDDRRHFAEREIFADSNQKVRGTPAVDNLQLQETFRPSSIKQQTPEPTMFPELETTQRIKMYSTNNNFKKPPANRDEERQEFTRNLMRGYEEDSFGAKRRSWTPPRREKRREILPGTDMAIWEAFSTDNPIDLCSPDSSPSTIIPETRISPARSEYFEKTIPDVSCSSSENQVWLSPKRGKETGDACKATVMPENQNQTEAEEVASIPSAEEQCLSVVRNDAAPSPACSEDKQQNSLMLDVAAEEEAHKELRMHIIWDIDNNPRTQTEGDVKPLEAQVFYTKSPSKQEVVQDDLGKEGIVQSIAANPLKSTGIEEKDRLYWDVDDLPQPYEEVL